MYKRLLFLFNIHSGKGSVKPFIGRMIDGYTKLGFEVTAFSTQYAGYAEEKVLEYADSTDVIVCAGGDGTVSEAIAGIYRSGKDIPLVFVPCGSTNDYAATLKIQKDPMRSVERIERGLPVKLDIGRFNERHFDYVAAFGLLTDISYTTDQNLKNMIGYGAYVLEVTKRLFNIPVLKMTFETEDGRVYKGDWFYGMITNTISVGGIKNITGRDIELDDGLFEVTLVRATSNPIEFVEVLTSLKAGTDFRFIERFKTRKLTVRSQEPIAWTLDGEPGGSHTEVEIENINKAVTIMIPGGKTIKKK